MSTLLEVHSGQRNDFESSVMVGWSNSGRDSKDATYYWERSDILADRSAGAIEAIGKLKFKVPGGQLQLG